MDKIDFLKILLFVLGVVILCLDLLAFILMALRKDDEAEEQIDAVYDFIMDKTHIPFFLLRVFVLLMVLPLTIPTQIKILLRKK